MKDFGNKAGVCRQCLNQRYGTSLLPSDCRYSTYSMLCPGCNQMHQIPIGFRFRGKMKIILKK
jgi:hypothetical protein